MNEAGENVVCNLCPNNCKIKNGGFGMCGVRGNKSGKGIIPFYGFISALAVDPIEKKPLYHFKPGSKILSLGFTGCNLRCPFCQNWHISQNTDICSRSGGQGQWMQPGEAISALLKHNTLSFSHNRSIKQDRHALHDRYSSQSDNASQDLSIAYTYSEPLVHPEYIIDCMVLARRHCIANVLITNGCIKTEAAAEILKFTDAINVDLKCFSPETYSKI